MVFIHKRLQPRHHRRWRRHLLHRLLGVQPAAGVVITQAHHLGLGDGLICDARLFFHAPQHKPARRLRARVEVVAFGIVFEQFDPVARMQPAFFAIIFIEQTGYITKTGFMWNHLRQRPAPGLPVARWTGGALAPHDDGDFNGGTNGGHKVQQCNGLTTAPWRAGLSEWAKPCS